MRITIPRRSNKVKESHTEYGRNISRPSSVYELFKTILRREKRENPIDSKKEKFYTVGLNQNNGIQFIELVSMGSLTAATVHPREVLRPVIIISCPSFICVHNHPSGNTTPSNDDLELTRSIRNAAEIMGICMLDHLIIGYDPDAESELFNYLSIFEENSEFRA